MKPLHCIIVVAALVGCGESVVEAGYESAESSTATETSRGEPSAGTTSGRQSEGDGAPESGSVGGLIGTDTEMDADTGLDGDPPIGDCRPIEATRVDHVAFYGASCHEAPAESAVLSTQAEVDAHVAEYCDGCWRLQKACPNRPTLKKDTAIIYAYTGTPGGPAHLEILSVGDCGEFIIVEGFAEMGCQLGFDRAWDSVEVPAFDKPVEYHITQELSPGCRDR